MTPWIPVTLGAKLRSTLPDPGLTFQMFSFVLIGSKCRGFLLLAESVGGLFSFALSTYIGSVLLCFK